MKLLVEGATERRLIPQLMKAQGIAWDKADIGTRVPHIVSLGGVTNILKRGTFSTEFKSSSFKSTSLERLGVIVDANGNAPGRWEAIRQRCASDLPDMGDLPEQIPAEGFVRQRADGSWLGVWIMPDNRQQGAAEEFLLDLVPDGATELVEYAKRCVDEARQRGASLRDEDVTKSVVHTWLAWHEEPGPQLHEAVMRRLLDPQHPQSQPFISWFTRLFALVLDGRLVRAGPSLAEDTAVASAGLEYVPGFLALRVCVWGGGLGVRAAWGGIPQNRGCLVAPIREDPCGC